MFAKMKYPIILSLSCQIYCFAAEFMSVTRMQPKPHCLNPNKTALIEHFFNTIFTEFYSAPPVCVCVQMCAGQSTYCYPTGCLKSAAHEEHEAKTETTQYPIMQKNKNHFMLLKGERDFMTEYLERNYVDESKEPSQPHNPVENLHPDIFKKKYSFVAKYKTAPNVNLRHTVQDKVKKEVGKIEGGSRQYWTNTRWPLNTLNWRNGHRTFQNIDNQFKTKESKNYFATLLRDNEVAEYPPKYFKRELTKTVDDDEGNIKAFYHVENSLNMTDNNSFSLETLIDNLIRSSFETHTETTTNIAIAKRDDLKIESQLLIEKLLNVNSTGLVNETTSVISMNLTNENVEKNKYLDTTQMKKTANLNNMITILANRIEIENNTSMEIARKTIKDFDEETLKINNDKALLSNSTMKSTEINLIVNETSFETLTTETTVTTTDMNPETTISDKVKVTKKNRQKVVKKGSSKMNNPDINLKF